MDWVHGNHTEKSVQICSNVVGFPLEWVFMYMGFGRFSVGIVLDQVRDFGAMKASVVEDRTLTAQRGPLQQSFSL